MNMQSPQSPALDESEILPLQQEDRTADNPMGTVMAFAGTLFSLEIVGGLNGGISMPQNQHTTPSFDTGFEINNELSGMKPPSMM